MKSCNVHNLVLPTLVHVAVTDSFLLLYTIHLWIYRILFIHSIFYLIFSVLFPLPFSPHIPLPPGNDHTVVHVHESFLLFAQSLLPLTSPPPAVILLSIYESVSIFLVSSVCSLDSTCEYTLYYRWALLLLPVWGYYKWSFCKHFGTYLWLTYVSISCGNGIAGS